MKLDKMVWLILLCIISYLVMAFVVCNKKPVPMIRTHTDTLSVQVIIHDTVTVEKTREKIVVRSVPVIQYQRVMDTISEISDTENCYAVEQFYKDGAAVRAEMCSRAFAKRKPADLHASIAYVPPPDTMRTIRITDTVAFEKPHTWKHVKIFGIGCGIGITAGAIGAILIGR
jgi:hypothetical protein